MRWTVRGAVEALDVISMDFVSRQHRVDGFFLSDVGPRCQHCVHFDTIQTLEGTLGQPSTADALEATPARQQGARSGN